MFVPAKEIGQVDFEIIEKWSGFDETPNGIFANCKI